jgi:hypothetical protein
MLVPTKMGANNDEDMVVIRVGDIGGTIAYQTAFEFAQGLRVACKSAARFDRVPANFWVDVDMEDFDDLPRPHRGFRRSTQVPTIQRCRSMVNGAEICVEFDGRGRIMGYEDGIKLHQKIRRAGRMAKAWAGDAGKSTRMLAMVTDGEENDRLGLS